MKILIAPAPFKGSMTALQAASLIAKGIQETYPAAEIVILPVADGGEGTAQVLVAATQGKLVKQVVHGPLMSQVSATYGITGDGTTAVIEMAEASGLCLIPQDARNPMLTTTYGTGELIRNALEHGVRKIILCVGGSATVDGGLGMAQAIGIRFLDEHGQEVRFGAQGLFDIEIVDVGGVCPGCRDVTFLIACDSQNPLLGPDGAASVYGPQKGATSQMVTALEQGLAHFATILEKRSGKPLAKLPGTGAGGGIALPLLAFFEAKLCPGSELVFAVADFVKRLEGCDLVITGEGRLDSQSLFGKAPVAVARECKQLGIPVIALCGSIGSGAEKTHAEGIVAYFSALQRPLKEMELPDGGPAMLKECAAELGRLLKWCTGTATMVGKA